MILLWPVKYEWKYQRGSTFSCKICHLIDPVNWCMLCSPFPGDRNLCWVEVYVDLDLQWAVIHWPTLEFTMRMRKNVFVFCRSVVWKLLLKHWLVHLDFHLWSIKLTFLFEAPKILPFFSEELKIFLEQNNKKLSKTRAGLEHVGNSKMLSLGKPNIPIWTVTRKQWMSYIKYFKLTFNIKRISICIDLSYVYSTYSPSILWTLEPFQRKNKNFSFYWPQPFSRKGYDCLGRTSIRAEVLKKYLNDTGLSLIASKSKSNFYVF